MERHGLDKLVNRRTEAKRKRSAWAMTAVSCRPSRAPGGSRAAWRARGWPEERAEAVVGPAGDAWSRPNAGGGTGGEEWR
jgi:hypothetical protein